MVRNLKILILSLAVVALCAVATSAQAALLHSEVEPTRITIHNDGTEGTATAHHVREIQGLPITCKGIEGSGTANNKTQEAVTIAVSYKNCDYLGLAATANMNGCDYVLNANGSFIIGSKAGHNCATEPITYSGPNICTVKIGPQTLNGIKYHNVGQEVTVEMSVTGISGVLVGFFCRSEGSFTNGEYTTGNTLVTGETDNAAGEMKKIWVE